MSTEQFSEPPVEMLEPWGKSGPDAEKEALEGIKHLWKLDDPEWVAKREQDWLSIQDGEFSDTPKKERKIYENYFRYGQKEGYMAEVITTILTPYTSDDEFLKLFESKLIDPAGRSRIYSDYIYD